MAIKQPIKNQSNKIDLTKKNRRNKTNSHYTKNKKQKYGTSQLERDFARDFLDKLGLKYIYQYEASDIKRFFDFAVTAYKEIPFIMETKDGINSIKQEYQNVPISFIVEVDGGYW